MQESHTRPSLHKSNRLPPVSAGAGPGAQSESDLPGVIHFRKQTQERVKDGESGKIPSAKINGGA